MHQTAERINTFSIDMADVLERAKQILIKKSFVLSGDPVADGKIHRVQVGNGKANLVGWYVLYPDEPPFLTGGNWRTGEEFKEALGGGYSQQTPSDKALMDQRMAEAKRQRDEEQGRIHAQAAIESKAEYDAADPATDNHGYLVKKQVKAYGGIKIRRGCLVLPVMNERGEIRSSQTITADGEKRFKTGGEIRGNYFTIPGDSRHIVISEGYATGATIHELAGWTVVIAFNAGNLPLVAKKIRMQYPASEILIAADNDQWTEGNPGVSKATAAGVAINARVVIPQFKDKSSKPTDFNDLFRLEGQDAVIRQLAGVILTPAEPDTDAWDIAQQHFPLTSFPWGALPVSIADSLQQLGRSHATSSTPLPGAAIAILSSVVGATVAVSPKVSWTEPLIFWFGDVRPSGSGKTGAPRALCRPLYSAQSAVDEAYRAATAELPPGEKKTIPRARGYYMTDLTLEGIRGYLSGHGGSVVILDEISSFVSAQNQYKAKGGNDREAWLCLHDGQPARVVRAKESITIHNSRVSIFGGIQPAVWRAIFSGKNEILQSDGTIFRFLSTSEGERFYPLTTEAWDESNREIWESTLLCAMRWADEVVSNPEWKPRTLLFDESARDHFISWRNRITELLPDLPAPVRGFIPKTVGYAVRLTGALYLMDRFSKGQAPGPILSLSDVQRGIVAATFFLGHAVNLMRGLSGDVGTGVVADDESKRLAETLESMRGVVDSGKLAIGHISAAYNQDSKLFSDRGIGSLVRRCGLTIKGGLYDANGRRRVSCMVWDGNTEKFLRNMSPKSPSLQSEENQIDRYGDIENAMSPSLHTSEKIGDMETYKNTSLHMQHTENKDFGDVGDLETCFLSENENGCGSFAAPRNAV